MAAAPSVNPYLSITIPAISGAVSGAIASLLNAWYQRRAAGQQLAQSWFQETYLENGVDALISYANEALWFGAQQSRERGTEFLIPHEAANRIGALIGFGNMILVSGTLHPEWRDKLYPDGAAEFETHAAAVISALEGLRAALLTVTLTSRSGTAKLRNDRRVMQARQALVAVHAVVTAYIEKVGLKQELTRLSARRSTTRPTAWDSHFAHVEDGAVLVTLNDGTQIAGVFTDGSFASSSTSERDIYLSQMLDIGEDGSISHAQPPRGILIAAGNIRHIQFYNVQEGSNGAKARATGTDRRKTRKSVHSPPPSTGASGPG